MVHHNHSGDPGVMRQCRRFELTLQPDGWRGNVEETITKELELELKRQFDDDFMADAAELYIADHEYNQEWKDDGSGFIEDSKAEEKGDYLAIADGKDTNYFDDDNADEKGSKYSEYK